MYYACSDWSIPVGLDQSIQTRKFPAKRFFKNNYCGYFIKELLPNGFPCLDNVIQTLGMLLDFRKAKNTRLAARVFVRFFTVSQHPACLDHVIQTRKTVRYFFNLNHSFAALPTFGYFSYPSNIPFIR